MNRTKLVRLCAELCVVSYPLIGHDDDAWERYARTELIARATASDYSFENVAVFIQDTSYCLRADVGDFRIYAFRGTSHGFDVIRDLQSIRLSPVLIGNSAGLAAGRGFESHAAAIWPHIGNDIVAAQDDTKRQVIFTGHSLGGAIAHLSALRTLSLNRHVYGLVTFGCPRVFNHRTATIVEGWLDEGGTDVVRVVNLRDFVSRVPTTLRFRHVSRPHYRDSFGNVKARASSSYVLFDRARMWWPRLGNGRADDIDDHRMESYRRMAHEEIFR